MRRTRLLKWLAYLACLGLLAAVIALALVGRAGKDEVPSHDIVVSGYQRAVGPVRLWARLHGDIMQVTAIGLWRLETGTSEWSLLFELEEGSTPLLLGYCSATDEVICLASIDLWTDRVVAVSARDGESRVLYEVGDTERLSSLTVHSRDPVVLLVLGVRGPDPSSPQAFPRTVYSKCLEVDLNTSTVEEVARIEGDDVFQALYQPQSRGFLLLGYQFGPREKGDRFVSEEGEVTPIPRERFAHRMGWLHNDGQWIVVGGRREDVPPRKSPIWKIRVPEGEWQLIEEVDGSGSWASTGPNGYAAKDDDQGLAVWKLGDWAGRKMINPLKAWSMSDADWAGSDLVVTCPSYGAIEYGENRDAGQVIWVNAETGAYRSWKMPNRGCPMDVVWVRQE